MISGMVFSVVHALVLIDVQSVACFQDFHVPLPNSLVWPFCNITGHRFLYHIYEELIFRSSCGHAAGLPIIPAFIP